MAALIIGTIVAVSVKIVLMTNKSEKPAAQ
jgi:hypothetical protein